MGKFDLFLFLKAMENLSEEHISSLQAFETSLLMAVHDRWIASVISITNGIETLLRVRYGRTGDLLAMISSAVEDGLISKALGDRGHEIRKLRNRFVHSMVSPQDSPFAAYSFFMNCIPLYRRLFKGLANEIDVFDVLENEKIRPVYELTRAAISRSKPHSDGQSIDTLGLTVFKKVIANSALKSVYPLWVNEKINEWHVDHKNQRLPSNVDALCDQYEALSFLRDTRFVDLINDTSCPAYPCTGFLLLELSQSAELKNSPIDVVDRACCPLCDLVIADKIQLQLFVEPQLSPDWVDDQIAKPRGKCVTDERYIDQSLRAIQFMIEMTNMDGSITELQARGVLEAALSVRKVINLSPASPWFRKML